MWFKKKIDQLIHWYTNRSVWSKLAISLVSILGILLSGVSIKVKTTSADIQIFNSTNFPEWFIILISLIIVFLILYAMYLEHSEKNQKNQLMLKRNILVIEQRGLRIGGNDDPLADKVKDIYPDVNITPKLIDLRNCYGTNSLFIPELAISRINNLKDEVESLLSSYNRSDSAVIYGGICPVPITFLTGFILDDEFRIDVYDWDRTNGKWFQIQENSKIETEKFQVSGFESNNVSDEIVFTISVSYLVDHNGIKKLFPILPKIDLTFNSLDKDNHWNIKTQKLLINKFFATLKSIDQLNVKKIHLFIAAQNSVVFNLGRIYDQRNLPEIYVYQYERSFDPPYPWAIKMPTNGVIEPSVIDFNRDKSSNGN